jgi:ATP-dependent DNA ligase
MYLYPPRPVETTKHTELYKYDNGLFLAQPKYNGTCCEVFMNETEMIVMNRHNQPISSKYHNIDLRGMYRGSGWMVICGEFLNKNKTGEDGLPFNLKFVIWDILVYNGKYLIGSTFEQRMNLLEQLYPCSKMKVGEKFESLNYLCFTEHKNVYKAPVYPTSFAILFELISKVDVYEGLVLKRKDAPLKYGLSEKNNNDWQIKCRKPTKNYRF